MKNFEDVTTLPHGLSTEEVERLTAEGKVNISQEKVGKSYAKIIKDNLFTFFNLIWAAIATVLIICGSYKDLTFLAVVILNTVIAITQEIKAKRTVERLSMTTDPRATVVRNGEITEIAASEIVLGDVMIIEIGKQVLSDATVISGLAEANESLLTGEADAIKKQTGDRLLAGSYLVSGSVYAEVTHVGRDNYVHKLEKAAKSFKAPSSNLFRDLNRLIKSIGAILIPLAIAVFFTTYISLPSDAKSWVVAITKTCGYLVAMIPAGLYLLVTMTLTLSVLTLSRRNTLVQDMYSIEMLASADVVCLDKTGTITDGTMQVTSYKILDGTDDGEFRTVMAAIEGCEQSVNNTSRALIDFFGMKLPEENLINQIPFSSARKYSAVMLRDLGGFSIGAPHFAPAPVSAEMESLISEEASEGRRVILVSRHSNIEEEGTPLALIAISDRIRPAAKETIKSFQDQGVTLKVISGDHAKTVSTIATQVGIANADKYLSCEGISDIELVEAAENYAVFGRVTPEQKVLLIKTLKSNGHTVAMTGDGVNDTLALKESNCAIAMADGSEVARKISQIVLMDSDFSTLPDVVREGRKCINNVRQSASLFLMKTLFAMLLAMFSIVTLAGYPFAPNQMFILELLVIGFASLALALEPNNKRIEGSFLEAILVKSLPNAIAMFIPVLALLILGKFSAVNLDVHVRNAIAMCIITLVGYINLIFICIPFTKWRAAVVALVGVLLSIAIPVSIFVLGDMFEFGLISENLTVFFIMLLASAVCTVILQLFRGHVEKVIEKHLAKQTILFDDTPILEKIKKISKKK